MAKNWFDGIDLFRICRLMEIGEKRDYPFYCGAIAFLTVICAAYARQFESGDIFQITPDPVIRGIRMLLYQDDFIITRKKYPDEIKLLRELSKSNDLKEMTNYLIDNIDNLLSFLP